jgi:hypothetical protein
MAQTPDYREMTKTQLMALARRKKIPLKAGLLKEDLVKALKKGLRKIKAQKKPKPKVATKQRKAPGPAKKKSARTSKSARKTGPAKRKTTKTTVKKSATKTRKTARTQKTAPTAPASQPSRTGLPDRYEDHRLVVLTRDPNWAFVYWDLDPKRMRERAPGKKPAHWVLRVYAATPHPLVEKGAFFDVDINVEDGSYYLDLARPGARFVVEIGVVDASGWFHATAQSNPVILPLDHPSDTAASLGIASCRDGLPAFSNHRRPGPVKGP